MWRSGEHPASDVRPTPTSVWPNPATESWAISPWSSEHLTRHPRPSSVLFCGHPSTHPLRPLRGIRVSREDEEEQHHEGKSLARGRAPLRRLARPWRRSGTRRCTLRWSSPSACRQARPPPTRRRIDSSPSQRSATRRWRGLRLTGRSTSATCGSQRRANAGGNQEDNLARSTFAWKPDWREQQSIEGVEATPAVGRVSLAHFGRASTRTRAPREWRSPPPAPHRRHKHSGGKTCRVEKRRFHHCSQFLGPGSYAQGGFDWLDAQLVGPSPVDGAQIRPEPAGVRPTPVEGSRNRSLPRSLAASANLRPNLANLGGGFRPMFGQFRPTLARDRASSRGSTKFSPNSDSLRSTSANLVFGATKDPHVLEQRVLER